MGQGQSQDFESDPGDPSGPGSQVEGSTEPGLETTANTVWYQDESPDPPPAEEAVLLPQGEEVHAPTTGDGDTMAVNQTSASPQSENSPLEISERNESAVSPLRVCGAGDLLEHDPCFQVSASALSQVGDSGAQPVPSHVPGAQRQEASGKQRDEGEREEGEEAERKERGADSRAHGAAGGDDGRRANSEEESVGREEAERGPEEGAEEAADKGRKKKRRKKARRGAVEAKLSSSSSTESHVLMDTQAEAETQPQSNSPVAEAQAEIQVQPGDVFWAEGREVADQGDLPGTERPVDTQTQPVAQAVAGSHSLATAWPQPGPPAPCPSESVLREEVDAGTMRLPSQTADKSVDCSKPIVALTHTDSHSPASSLAPIDGGSKAVCEFPHSEGPNSTELSDLTVPVECNISIQPVVSNTPAENIESIVSDLNVVNVDHVVPTEPDYGLSDRIPESRGAFELELSEQSTAELVTAVELNSSPHVEALEAQPNSADQRVTTMTMETAVVACLSESNTGTTMFTEVAEPPPPQAEERAADVLVLKAPEGNAEEDATGATHSGHCFEHAQPPGDGPSEDATSEVRGRSETRRGSGEGSREAEVQEGPGTKSCTRNTGDGEGVDASTVVHGCSPNERCKEEENGSKDREGDYLRYKEELAAATVAVVTVAIASALASVELSRRLPASPTEGRLSKELSLEEQTRIRPSAAVSSGRALPLDTTNLEAAVSESELATVLPTGTSHASHESSDTDEYCSLDDNATSDDEYQLRKVEESQVEESVSPSKHSAPIDAHINLKQSTGANLINAEQVASEVVSVQNHCLDLDLTIKAANPAQADMTTSRESNEVLEATQPPSPTGAPSGGQLCQDDGVPCPVVDTGQGNGEQLDVLDANATENPSLQECTDDSPGELNCSLFEEPPCVGHDPERAAGVPPVPHFLETESCETDESPETPNAGPVGEDCATGREGTGERVCEEGEGELHKEEEEEEEGSAQGQMSPSEPVVVCSSESGAVARDDEVSTAPFPACKEVFLPITPDSLPCFGAPLSPPKGSPGPVAPGDAMSAQPWPDMVILGAPMEFHLEHEGDGCGVMCDGGGVFPDQGGSVGSLDTVDGCKDPGRTSGGEGTWRIMITAQEGSKTETGSLHEASHTPQTISEGALHTEIQREKEAFFPLQPCPEPCPAAPVSSALPAPAVTGETVRCAQRFRDNPARESAELDDCVFKKPAPPGSWPEPRDRRVCSSWSSTDDSSTRGPASISSLHSLDTASVDTASTDTASVDAGDLAAHWIPGGPWKSDEEVDNPVTSAILRASNRPLSPFRRHSWDSQRILPVEVRRTKPALHRRSMSWCPSSLPRPDLEQIDNRSCSLEGLEPLTKSISMVAISQRETDGPGSFSTNSGSLEYSICEEEPGPLRSNSERGGVIVGGVGGTKVSRTFSYLRSKMSKKNKGSDKEKRGEKERESKEREKRPTSGHAFSPTSPPSGANRDRWSTLAGPEDPAAGGQVPRRNPSILSFSTHSNLSKSISTSNIAGLDDVPLKGLKFLSHSTDNLHQGSKVNASTESLTDEGTEMMDSQLMGEFECDARELEADSWSAAVDRKFLKLQKKDEVKRQDVIYELYQTELHHVRTLRIMSEVFPVLDDLLETHTHFLTLLLERRRASLGEGQDHCSFLIHSIGDVLVNQFSGCNADRMRKVYGKFCSRHNEAVNLYKELHAKDKRFQALIKRLMSSSIVRRLSIPECILLVTQRITKYPVLIQRILQHTKGNDHASVAEALRCVKELIGGVDSKVNEQEKKTRLREVYSRTDSKSIMRMKSGQMFAKEDLIRGRRLLHDGALQLKNTAGRLKDVHAMLLSDVLVFLQEKDQKYVFASLDQRSTVVSLQKLIVREVANEERGLFLITAGTEKPEMVEVLASSKDERNTWRSVIQDTMNCIEKDEDEGVPSETEEDRRQQENRAKEIRELLRRKDEQIVSLLEEKVHIFKDLCDCNPALDEGSPPIRERMLFRATPDDVTKGEPIIKDALKEVESLHTLVNSSVGGAAGSTAISLTGGSVGPVCLPRRAETFGGFDSHQMNSSKSGEKEEGDDALDLRRTESDGGANTSLQMLLKRNNEQVQHSVGHLHGLLTSLQAVVVQQDSFIEDQRQALSERLGYGSLSSSSSSRPSSLIEQEKQRSLERQRQEAASLQKQQDERQELQRRKEEYQRDLERLREAQKRLERDREALRRETERLEALRSQESGTLQKFQRTSSSTSEDSLRFHSSNSLDLETREAPEAAMEVELSSSAPTKEPFLRIGSKRMGKNFNPFSSSSSSSSSKNQGGDKDSQVPNRLLQLTKTKA
ncbi:hypothetical protein NHX12_003281, partial [Muraenolepis orangiensis]